MPWQDIVKALETGSMKAMGAPIERRRTRWRWRVIWGKPVRLCFRR